jgi:hypothetical protein
MICENNEVAKKRERDELCVFASNKKQKMDVEEYPFPIQERCSSVFNGVCVVELGEVDSLKRERDELCIFAPNKKLKMEILIQKCEEVIEITKKRKIELAEAVAPQCAFFKDITLCTAYDKRLHMSLLLLSGAYEAVQAGRLDEKVMKKICFVIDDTVTSQQDGWYLPCNQRVAALVAMAFSLCEQNQYIASVIGEKVIWLKSQIDQCLQQG